MTRGTILEHFALAAKHRPAPSPPHSPSRRSLQSTVGSTSKALAALEANMSLLGLGSSHASDEVEGPAGLTLDTRKRKVNTSARTRHASAHPFFVDGPFGTDLAKATTSNMPKTIDPPSLSSAAPELPRSSASKPRPRAPRSRASGSTSASTSTLPLYHFSSFSPSPVVVYTQHEDEANELVQTLRGPLGLDMEWKFFWVARKQTERRTALVQLCDARTILLIQVSSMKKFPQKVKEVLESPDIVKTGANIKNDGNKLSRDFGILASNLVELGAFAREADPSFASRYNRKIVALATMTAEYTGRTLDKGPARTSDWEQQLTEEQRTYAANDVHCGLMVYLRLLKLADMHDRILNPSLFTSDLAANHRARLACAQAAPDPSTTSPSPNPTPDPSSSSVPQPIASRTSSASTASSSQTTVLPGQRQHIRAYRLWHERGMDLEHMCAMLRSADNPLKESTVISYVVKALQMDGELPYDFDNLKALVQLEAGSWQRHREWIQNVELQRT